MVDGVDFGRILQQAGAIQGQRQQNVLGQQEIQQNVLAQRQGRQFNELLQQFVQGQGGGDINALAALDPRRTQEFVDIRGKQQEFEQEEARRTVKAADAIINSEAPKKLTMMAFPEFVEALRGQGVEIEDLTDEQVVTMAREVKVKMSPQAGIETKTFAPTTIVNPETGEVERVITTVRDGQVSTQAIGRAPTLTPEQASELTLREASKAADIRVQSSIEEVKGKDKVTRENTFIDNAFAAAGEIQDINRAIDLIERVETSGFEAAKTAVTDFLGTTPGDVGELRRLLAQNVLDGLAAFTGAISEGERQFLSDISTSMSQGKEVNKRNLARLKRIATNSIKRGEKILERRGDTETLELFRDALGQTTPSDVPPGSVPAGTFNGNPVFRTPDGKMIVIE